MTTNERFDETHKAVTFMGLDVVTDWFGEAVAPVLVTAFEKTGRLINGIVTKRLAKRIPWPKSTFSTVI